MLRRDDVASFFDTYGKIYVTSGVGVSQMNCVTLQTVIKLN